MAAITASMVGALRAKTDAPMMECKKALAEAEGDMERAEELLRVKLGSKAGKAASRITAEGVVAASVDGSDRRDGRSQLRNRLRQQERFVPRVREGLRRPGRDEEPGRRRRAVRAAVRAGQLRPDCRGRPQGTDRQDRREHVDPSLQALCRRRPPRDLPARHPDRRAGRVRRRRGRGQGCRDACRRDEAGRAVSRPMSRRR